MTTLTINWSHLGELEYLVCVYMGMELVAWAVVYLIIRSPFFCCPVETVSGD